MNDSFFTAQGAGGAKRRQHDFFFSRLASLVRSSLRSSLPTPAPFLTLKIQPPMVFFASIVLSLRAS